MLEGGQGTGEAAQGIIPALTKSAHDALSAEQYDNAAQLFARVVTADTTDPGLLTPYMEAVTALGNQDQTVAVLNQLHTAYNRIISEPPAEPGRAQQEQAQLLVGMTTAYGRLGHYESAMTCATGVFALQPDNPEVDFLRRITGGENPSVVAQGLKAQASEAFGQNRIHLGRKFEEKATMAALAGRPPMPGDTVVR